MTPAEFCARILDPARLAFPFHDDPRARALLLAIAGVESAWTARWQEPRAYARSFWMVQQNCVNDLLAHPSSGPVLRQFAAEMEIPIGGAFEALAWHDAWAYACARCLLWTDPHPLPEIGDTASSMAAYENIWRPGKFSAERWTARFTEALAVSGPAVA